MSWDSYLDNLCAQAKSVDGTEHIDKCCIIGLECGKAWSTNEHPKALELSADEGANIARVFKTKDFSPFMANGFTIGRTKYQCLRVDDCKVAFGKKKGEGAVTMQCTKTAILIGHCPEGGQQGYTTKAVGTIADYVESLFM